MNKTEKFMTLMTLTLGHLLRAIISMFTSKKNTCHCALLQAHISNYYCIPNIIQILNKYFDDFSHESMNNTFIRLSGLSAINVCQIPWSFRCFLWRNQVLQCCQISKCTLFLLAFFILITVLFVIRAEQRWSLRS